MSRDDETEIEMTAEEPTPVPASVAPPRKQPRRRTPNPVVDEPIHTGEIQPRSHIIRSSPSMEIPKIAIELADEKTELTAPPIMVPEPAAPRQHARAVTAGVRRKPMWPVFAGIGVAVAGVIIAFVLVSGNKAHPTTTSSGSTAASATDQHRIALQAAAQFIGTSFDADAKAALVRAEAMATSSMLRAGILTDAQTLQDMAKDKDVVFKLGAGDALEVFQVRDGQRTPLLRMPSTDAALDAPPVGKTKIVLRDGAPAVVANAQVDVQQGTSGEVILATPIDVEPIKKRVADHAVEATIVGLDAPIVLVKSGKPGGEKVKLIIDTELKLPIALEVVLAK